MDDFARDVLDVVRQRLPELGAAPGELPDGELSARFGREEVLEPSFHFEVELAGEACAFSVAPLAGEDAERREPLQTVEDEVVRLQQSGRLALLQPVIAAPRGMIVTDIVSERADAAGDAELERAMGRFLDAALDHKTVLPIIRPR
jgi:hypothetical protein